MIIFKDEELLQEKPGKTQHQLSAMMSSFSPLVARSRRAGAKQGSAWYHCSRSVISKAEASIVFV